MKKFSDKTTFDVVVELPQFSFEEIRKFAGLASCVVHTTDTAFFYRFETDDPKNFISLWSAFGYAMKMKEDKKKLNNP